MFYRKEMNLKMGESKKKFSNKIYKVKGKNVFKLIGLIMIMAAVIS